jgi:hypothetical protein
MAWLAGICQGAAPYFHGGIRCGVLGRRCLGPILRSDLRLAECAFLCRVTRKGFDCFQSLAMQILRQRVSSEFLGFSAHFAKERRTGLRAARVAAWVAG